jgi:hypothetical protein
MTKSGKEFLVENAIRLFEEKKFWFPEGDSVLFKQLNNYHIIRRNISNNKPIYGPLSASVGDHRLDAMMLAVGGLFLEKSIYSGSNYGANPTGIVSKEELELRTDNFKGAVERAYNQLKTTRMGSQLKEPIAIEGQKLDEQEYDLISLIQNRNREGNAPSGPRGVKKENDFASQYKQGKPRISVSAYEFDEEASFQRQDQGVRIAKRKSSRRGFRRR